MAEIRIDDLKEEKRTPGEAQVTEEELKDVKGGIALLLPAVQKARELPSTSAVLGDGSVKTLGT